MVIQPKETFADKEIRESAESLALHKLTVKYQLKAATIVDYTTECTYKEELIQCDKASVDALTARYTVKDTLEYPIEWRTMSNTFIELLNASEVTELMLKMVSANGAILGKYWQQLTILEQATTIAECDSCIVIKED